MCKKIEFLCAMMILALLVCPGKSAAQTAAVVAGSCLHGVKSYPTIQEAVNSVASGGTVFVCPGTYVEQVTITGPLKLAGVRSAGQAASIIMAPATLVSNATSSDGFSFPALLAVQNGSGVSVSDIVVDGGGINCNLTCVGIAFEGSSGIVKTSVVRNFPNITGTVGVAIEADGSTLTVQDNSLHQFYIGIQANGGVSTVRGNVISSGVNDISISQSTGSLIANNELLQTVGVPLFLSTVSSTAVSGNTVESNANNAGILIQDSQNDTVTGNRINGGLAGVELESSGPGSPPNSGNVVKANVFFNANIGVIVNDVGSPGGNTITNNSIIEANCGVETGQSLGDTLTPNNLLGVVATTCP